jgi:isoleucyl-tRNA synthetase
LRSEGERPGVERLGEHLVDELNVKEVRFIDDETAVLSYDVKPNLPVLGPKHGAALAGIRKGFETIDANEAGRAVRSGAEIEVAGVRLLPEEVLVTAKDSPGYATAQDAGYTVALTTELTPELEAEGLVREVVHRLQGTRKNAGLDIADYITAYVSGDEPTVEVLRRFDGYIRDEALAREVRYEIPAGGAFSEEHAVDGRTVVLGVAKA